MAVRRKNILYNKPSENLWAVYLCEKPITRISCLGNNVAVPGALATGHIIQQDGMPPNFHLYERHFKQIRQHDSAPTQTQHFFFTITL
jgi:hypothetical protein